MGTGGDISWAPTRHHVPATLILFIYRVSPQLCIETSSTLLIMAIHTRKIGNDVVSPIGFGLMALSAFYGATQKDEDRFKVGHSERTRINSSKLMRHSGSGCSARRGLYLLGYCRRLWRQRGNVGEMVSDYAPNYFSWS